MAFNGSTYDQYVAPLTRKFVQHLFHTYDDRNNEDEGTVLDVGCGTGCAIPFCGEHHYTGVDNDPLMVDLVAKRNKIAFHHDASCLPPEWGNKFTITISNFGVIFASDFAASISEMVRCTRAGGRIAISCWAEPTETRVFHLFGNALEACTGSRPKKGRVSVDVVEDTLKKALNGDVRVIKKTETLDAVSKEWLWRRFTETSKKLCEIIEALTEEQRAAVKEHVCKEIDVIGEKVGDDGYAFPVAAYIVTGVKN